MKTGGSTKVWLLRCGFIVYVFLLLFSLFEYNSRCKVSMPNVTEPRGTTDANRNQLCKLGNLGLVTVNLDNNASLRATEAEHVSVQPGGKWKPADCVAWQKVAVIIPYRDRWHHLKLLLARIHPMMQRQMLHYQIFVVEQVSAGAFNKGLLMNRGFVEAMKIDKFDCFIFHDVDLIPENDQNLYMCDRDARHLSPSIDEMRYHVMYYNCFGGVVALSADNFVKLNGYSNAYWGWGKEDDDMSARTGGAGLLLARPPNDIGRYKMIRHAKSYQAPHGYDLFLAWQSRWLTDGVNSIRNKVTENIEEKLYTLLRIDNGKAPSQPLVDKDTTKKSLLWLILFFFP